MRSLICLAAVLSLALAAAAQTSKPADADEKADLSSPKSALKTFFKAVMRGDADAAKKAAISNDEQNQFIDAMTGAMGSFHKLQAAAKEKFGDEASKIAPNQQDKQLEMLADADENIDGDSAAVKMKNAPGPATPLKKVGSDWKVDVANMPEMTQAKMAMPMFTSMKKFAEEFTTDIKADKFATADDAKTAFDKRMQEMMMSMAAHVGPTSQKAQPASP